RAGTSRAWAATQQWIRPVSVRFTTAGNCGVSRVLKALPRRCETGVALGSRRAAAAPIVRVARRGEKDDLALVAGARSVDDEIVRAGGEPTPEHDVVALRTRAGRRGREPEHVDVGPRRVQRHDAHARRRREVHAINELAPGERDAAPA